MVRSVVVSFLVMAAAAPAHEMITYGGVPTVFGQSRYQAEADRKSWQRFAAFLADTLKQ